MPAQLPPEIRGDRDDLPQLTLPADGTQKDLADALAGHAGDFAQLRLTEERRLLYVALTRAERTLLFSGHHWGPATAKPAGPSEFLLECAAFAEPFAEPDAWAPPPDPQDAAVMPRGALRGRSIRSVRRRPAVVAGADLVLGALADLAHPADLGEPARSGDAMNAERSGRVRTGRRPRIRSAGRRM